MPEDPIELLGEPGDEPIPVLDAEGLEVGDPVEPEGETEPEQEQPEKKIPENVPYARFQEVYQTAKSTKEQLAAMEAHNRQMYAALMNLQQQAAQAQREPKKPVDPEAAEFIKLIKPALDEYLSPVYEELQQTKQVNAQLQNRAISEAAWNYVQTSVPDIKDLAPELMAYIENRHDKEQILANPDRVVDIAEIVRLKKSAGKAGPSEQARKVGRSQAKSEVPSAQPRTSTKDWNSVSETDFYKAMRDVGF